MKNKLKNSNGFTTVDLATAVIVIMLFSSIFTSFIYNIYLSSTEAKRTATALNYAVDIFEHIGELSQSEVTGNSARILSVESIKGLKIVGSSDYSVTAKVGTYDIKLEISNHNNDDRIKRVKLTIDYPVSKNKTESLQLERLKVEETV